MVAVYKRAEWEASTEADPELFAAATCWAVRGLVRLCEDIDVQPIGALTITSKNIDDTDPIRIYELELELEHGPRIIPFAASGARCPVLGCKTVGYGRNDDEAWAATLKHWSLAHSAGDQFA